MRRSRDRVFNKKRRSGDKNRTYEPKDAAKHSSRSFSSTALASPHVTAPSRDVKKLLEGIGTPRSKAFEPDIPYVIAWVDLDEGPRLITNIVACPVEAIKLGMKVSVVFEQQSPEVWLPKFKPADI